MFQCMNCGRKMLVWQADFDFSDYGYEGEGIVQTYECCNCNARIIVEIPLEEEE